MKQLFFTTAAIAIPGAIFLWITWLFVKGVYVVAQDWHLERELRQIRRETQMNERTSSRDENDPLTKNSQQPSFRLDDEFLREPEPNPGPQHDHSDGVPPAN